MTTPGRGRAIGSAVLPILLFVPACQHHAPTFAESGMGVFAPLRIGMTRAERKTALRDGYEEFGHLVNPAQFALGGDVTLKNGIGLSFTFDNDLRIAMLTTPAETARLYHRLGPGCAYGDLKATAADVEAVKWPRYGVMATAPELQTDGRVLYFCFKHDEPQPLRSDAKVAWGEVRSAGDINWLTEPDDDSE